MDIPAHMLQALVKGTVSAEDLVRAFDNPRAASNMEGDMLVSVRKVSCGWEEEDSAGNVTKKGAFIGREATGNNTKVMVLARRAEDGQQVATVKHYFQSPSKIRKNSRVLDTTKGLVGKVVAIDDGLMNSGVARLTLERTVRDQAVRWVVNMEDCRLEFHRGRAYVEELKAEGGKVGTLARKAQ